MLLFAGLADAHDMVIIVGPKRIEIPTAFFLRLEQHAAVAVVLGDHVGAIAVRNFRRLGQQVDLRFVVDHVGGIHAETVDAKFFQPILDVLAQHRAHRLGILAVEVEVLAPWIVLSLVEKKTRRFGG